MPDRGPNAQTLANRCALYATDHPVHEGEDASEYLKRIRNKVIQIQRYERARKRKTVKAARKRNRR